MDRNEESSINSFNKNCLRLYEWSLQSLSNSSSNNLLSDVESSNHKLNVNGETDNHILEATNTILQKTDNDANYRKFWKVSLSKIDPESLLQKSLPTCTNCINQEYYGLEQFQQNECKCFPTVAATGTKTLHDIAHDNKRHKPLYGRNISEGCDDDKKISNDRNKHKFPRPKHTNDSYNSVQPSKSVSDEVDWSKKEEEEKAHKSNVAKITFKTAKEQLLASNPAARRVLGTSRKAQGKFVSPMIGSNVENKQESVESEFTDERLKHIDPKMIELIESEIIDKGAPIGWDDIAGLQLAKSVIQEAVVWPLLRPDIFTGLRRPPKGILLFGPPGTGKTLIGKCVASQCRATFFSISASSLTSKWIGDGEKMVRALFAVARCHQPAVIFIDEIDSLLTQRSDTEHEATRRIKTEFLVQFDGAATAEEDRVLIVGATNRPHELDEAARRRLVKRLYIPLPDEDARCQIVSALLRSERAALTAEDARAVARRAAGYSGADVRALCAEAAMGPVRALPLAQIATVQRDQVRPVCLQDFTNALQRVKPSVSQDDLGQYEKWNNTYGHGI